MRFWLIATSWLLLALPAWAQFDLIASEEIGNDHFRARIWADGRMFWDRQKSQFFAPPDSATSPIRAAGLWLGGIDDGGTFKTSIQQYNTDGKTDFFPGTLENYTGQQDQLINKVFKVRGEEIAAHRQDYQDNLVVDNPIPAVFGWPSPNNPHFEALHGLEPLAEGASFWDEDLDRNYNPELGDYPLVATRRISVLELFNRPPHEMVWSVFNDGYLNTQSDGEPVLMEVQATHYIWRCGNEGLINNTLFTTYRLINRAPEPIDSFFVGVYLDADIGCPQDDYLGTIPEWNTIYAYNASPRDTSCTQYASYGDNPPVVALTLLRGPSDEFGDELEMAVAMPVYPGDTTLPDGMQAPETSFLEYYRNLTGSWKDGSPLTYGGSGYQTGNPTPFAFSGNPAVDTGWTEPGAGLPPGDRAMIASFGPFRLDPGADNQLDFAISLYHQSEMDHMEKVQAVYDSVPYLINTYNYFGHDPNAQLLKCNPIVTSTRPATSPPPSWGLFPNPGRGRVWLSGLSGPAEITLSNALGEVVHHSREELVDPHPLDLSHLPPGLYVLSLRQGERQQSRRLVVH